MEDPFLYSVKLILDERYTDNMDKIYRIVVKVMFDYLEDECKKIMKSL